MQTWAAAIRLRQDVNGVLESARAAKRIGKALEAQVNLYCDEAAKASLAAVSGLNLQDVLLVSGVAIKDGKPASDTITGESVNFPGLTVEVLEAEGQKCPRCWMHSTHVSADGLCPRCAHVLSLLPQEETTL